MRIFVMIVCLVAIGCGNGSGTIKHDAAIGDAAADAKPDASCFTNPATHEEIINACTNAQKIEKPGKPPLQNADGTLPPLP